MKVVSSIRLVVLLTAVAALSGSGTGGVVPQPAEGAGQTLRLFLHGNDVPGIGDGFTMDAASPEPHLLQVDLSTSPHWFNDPPLQGRFEAGASFTLVKPCTVGLSVAPTYTLAVTDLAGNEIRQLGQTRSTLGVCIAQERIVIPTQGPFSLQDQRLKLSIGTTAGLTTNVNLSSGSYLEATNFANDFPHPALGVSDGSIQGQDASTPPGPAVTIGHQAEVLVVVFNDGNIDLTNLAGVSAFGPVQCQESSLDYGEPTYCWASGDAIPGSQQVTLTFKAQAPGGNIVQVQSVTYYRGVSPPVEP